MDCKMAIFNPNRHEARGFIVYEADHGHGKKKYLKPCCLACGAGSFLQWIPLEEGKAQWEIQENPPK